MYFTSSADSYLSDLNSGKAAMTAGYASLERMRASANYTVPVNTPYDARSVAGEVSALFRGASTPTQVQLPSYSRATSTPLPRQDERPMSPIALRAVERQKEAARFQFVQ